MMFSKFTALAVLAVTLLAVSTHGRPEFSESSSEGSKFNAAADNSSHSWLSRLYRDVHDRVNSYRHINGGVFEWAKHKLGFGKASGSNTATTPAALVTTVVPETTVVPKAPEVPKIPEIPKIPVMPKMPEEPKAPVAPKIIESAENVPDASTGAKTTEVSSPTGTEMHDAEQDADDENDDTESSTPSTADKKQKVTEGDTDDNLPSAERKEKLIDEVSDENAESPADNTSNMKHLADANDSENEENDIDPRSQSH